MEEWECSECGYVYNSENGDSGSGINPGTSFDDVPDSWVCPVCGADKSYFTKL